LLHRTNARRKRSDLTETFKIVNGLYDRSPEIFFEFDDAEKRIQRATIHIRYGIRKHFFTHQMGTVSQHR